MHGAAHGAILECGTLCPESSSLPTEGGTLRPKAAYRAQSGTLRHGAAYRALMAVHCILKAANCAKWGGISHPEGGKTRPRAAHGALRASSHYVLRAAFQGAFGAPNTVQKFRTVLHDGYAPGRKTPCPSPAG